MIVHLYMFETGVATKETNRVTMLEDGAPYQITGRVLVLGTKPNLTLYPLQEIQWFWIEEN